MNIEELHKKLIAKKLTISVAESCTGGLLSSKLTELNGSSKYFVMGLITYSNLAKIKCLKVNKNIIDRFGAVSPQCCKSMVEGLSKISKSNKFILYKIIEGILDLQISKDTVPDFATANTDFFKVWDFIFSSLMIS